MIQIQNEGILMTMGKMRMWNECASVEMTTESRECVTNFSTKERHKMHGMHGLGSEKEMLELD